MALAIGLLAVAALAFAMTGCSSSTSTSTSTSDASDGSCRMPDSLKDAGPGACTFGRALIQCTLPSGGGCGCITNGSACASCSGGTCQNRCSSSEYAVSCYQQPPKGCTSVGVTPGGNAYYCCPCQ